MIGGVANLLIGGQNYLQEHVRTFSRAIAREFQKTEKTLRKTVKRNTNRTAPIRGKTKKTDPDSTQDPDSLRKLVRVIDSSGVHSERKDGFEVDALWMTADAYRLLGDFDKYAALEDRSPKAKVLERAFLTDLAPLGQWLGEDVYLLVVNLISSPKRGPFLWDGVRLKERTVLENLSSEGRTVRPLEATLDAIPSSLLIRMKGGLFTKMPFPFLLRPVLYVFPAALEDGSPFISGLDQTIQLRSTVGGHPVELNFDLNHFQVTDLAALSLSGVD